MVATPLHHQFMASLHRPEKSFRDLPGYTPRLVDYRRKMIESQRFALDNDAVWEIADRSSLDAAQIMDRVQLAHLPFEQVWIEWSQHEKVTANYYAGRGPEPELDAIPEKVGFLIKRAYGRPTAWKATRVVSSASGEPYRVHGLTMFEYMFDAESPTQIAALDGTPSFVNNLPKGMMNGNIDPQMITKMLFGFTAEDPVNDPLNEADKKASVALNPVWKDWMDRGIERGGNPQTLADHLVTEFLEMVGEFRFLLTALALMNEVPIILAPSAPPQKRQYLAGGKLQTYLNHRTVRIDLPALKRKQMSVSDFLYEAGSKKRRHKVRRHRRLYLNPDGSIRKEKWIEEHERGDANLGYVTHDYEVSGKIAQAAKRNVA